MDKTYDVICTGMALLDSIVKGFDPVPLSASGYRAESGSLNIGGEAVNEAVAASRLGLRAAVLCALGPDMAGDMVAGALEKEGVDTSLIVRPANHRTPVTTMLVEADGSRKSITNKTHSYNFHPEEYTDCFAKAKAVILGSLFRAPFDDPGIIRAVLERAKSCGMLIIADTKIPNFRKLSLSDLKDSLPLIDYITPNEDEARYYTGKNDPEEMADVFLGYGVNNVIVKLGGKGCFFKNDSVSFSLPACPVEAVDATGAGDNFVAGFLSEILRGASVEEAMAFANACGAICTTQLGAGTALKNREQVLACLKA